MRRALIVANLAATVLAGLFTWAFGQTAESWPVLPTLLAVVGPYVVCNLPVLMPVLLPLFLLDSELGPTWRDARTRTPWPPPQSDRLAQEMSAGRYR